MRTVWKFPIGYPDRLDLEVPLGAEFIHFDMQGTTPTLWALVNSDNPVQRRSLRMIGTGHELPESRYNHIGSCIDANTGLVWHLFEEISQ